MGVKASGGISTLADLKAMVAAGATRIGASASVRIVEETARKRCRGDGNDLTWQCRASNRPYGSANAAICSIFCSKSRPLRRRLSIWMSCSPTLRQSCAA